MLRYNFFNGEHPCSPHEMDGIPCHEGLDVQWILKPDGLGFEDIMKFNYRVIQRLHRNISELKIS